MHAGHIRGVFLNILGRDWKSAAVLLFQQKLINDSLRYFAPISVRSGVSIPLMALSRSSAAGEIGVFVL